MNAEQKQRAIGIADANMAAFESYKAPLPATLIALINSVPK